MKSIRQTETFNAPAAEVYSAFIDEKKHAAFTGASAKINASVGGSFEVWDGYASGKNLELTPDKKIVQSWRASDWPEGVESKITLELSEEGGKTRLHFSQTGIPDEFADDVEQGWTDFYWQPLKEYLSKNL